MSPDPIRHAAASARPLVSLERLETRRLLASIEGNAFRDQDGDGLRDFFETPFDNVTVFLDSNRNLALDDGELSTTTDADGNYLFEDVPLGEYLLTIDPASGGSEELLATTSPGQAGRLISASAFDIELVFVDGNLEDRDEVLLETAAGIWESAIIGDLPDVMVDGEMIDDLRIEVRSNETDGPGNTLAFASYEERRADADGGLPFLGFINIDPADISTSRGFVETAVHEIGHVLGIGTLWDVFGLTDIFPGDEENFEDSDFNAVFTADPPPDDGPYNGVNAIREKDILFGNEPTDTGFGEPVVFEGLIPTPTFDRNGNFTGFERSVRPGSSYVHWDEETYGTELMTPFSEGGEFDPVNSPPLAPLSRLTLGGLEDLGYVVNYGAAENYGPLNIGPLPADFPDDIDAFLPFRYSVTVTEERSVANDANFGLRPNNAPSPFFFNADRPVAAEGQQVEVLAEIDTTANASFTGDIDFRDALVAMGFYVDSNGVEGLQTTGDVNRGTANVADTFLGEDFIGGDGFDFVFDTTGFADGDYVLYAAGYDTFNARTVRQTELTIDSTASARPERPTDLRVVGRDGESFTVVFDDNSTNEFGFLLQIASGAGQNSGTSDDFENFDLLFADGRVDEAYELIDQVLLAPQDGTGRYEAVYTLPEGADSNVERFFRLRSVNTAGGSAFAGRSSGATLDDGEIVIDNDDPVRVSLGGDFSRVVDAGAFALSYAAGTKGSVNYNPLFGSDSGPEAGRYTLLVNVPDVTADLGETQVDVFNSAGRSTFNTTFDGTARGAELVLGTFDFAEGDRIVFSNPGNGNAFADRVRLLRAEEE